MNTILNNLIIYNNIQRCNNLNVVLTTKPYIEDTGYYIPIELTSLIYKNINSNIFEIYIRGNEFYYIKEFEVKP